MKARRAAVLLGLLPCIGCYSLWEQKSEQKMAWSDGGTEPLEVWIPQGSGGVWFLFPLDVLATPLLIPVEMVFASVAAGSDDARISAGPFGFAASLLPVLTCMPLDNRPHLACRLHEPLPAPAEDRERLWSMSAREAIDWYARTCESAWGSERPQVAENVRRVVAAVHVGDTHPD